MSNFFTNPYLSPVYSNTFLASLTGLTKASAIALFLNLSICNSGNIHSPKPVLRIQASPPA
nr:MAG TPA: hypothetical protein [Crassvirales sp.]